MDTFLLPCRFKLLYGQRLLNKFLKHATNKNKVFQRPITHKVSIPWIYERFYIWIRKMQKIENQEKI